MEIEPDEVHELTFSSFYLIFFFSPNRPDETRRSREEGDVFRAVHVGTCWLETAPPHNEEPHPAVPLAKKTKQKSLVARQKSMGGRKKTRHYRQTMWVYNRAT